MLSLGFTCRYLPIRSHSGTALKSLLALPRLRHKAPVAGVEAAQRSAFQAALRRQRRCARCCARRRSCANLSQLGLDPGHNQLQSQSLHTISCHFIHTNSMAQLRANISCCMDHENTDLHCFLQSNCRLQKNSADSAWRTHFRAYYALSKDAASSPSEKK